MAEKTRPTSKSEALLDGKSDATKSDTKSEDTKALEDKIQGLEAELDRCKSMLSTAASAGQQLVDENDSLQKKVSEISKQLKDKQDALDTLHKTNELLKVTATRSGAEADELHKKLLKATKRIEQLQEDNALLSSLNKHNSSNLPQQTSDDDTNQLVEQLQHEKKALQQAYHDEQEKCAQFLENAEINGRKAQLAESENQDLKAQLEQLEHAYNALNHMHEQEMSKYEHSLRELQAEYGTLQHHLDESTQFADKSSPALLKEQSAVHRVSNIASDAGLGAELEELGYVEPPSPDNEHDHEDPAEQTTVDSASNSPSTQHFNKVTIDAQEEFFRLTVIAAKIKFHDVPISTQALWEKVKEANIAFHELADWLNEYLLAERAKLADNARKIKRINSITRQQVDEELSSQSPSKHASPSKHFFRRIKDHLDSVTNFSSTLRLEVRFGRRVFEVKMKKYDTLETLLQTLPRIIGEDAEAMELFKGHQRLNPELSLSALGLQANDVLRMIHRSKAAAFMQRHQHGHQVEAERSSVESVEKNGIEMESEEVKQAVRMQDVSL